METHDVVIDADVMRSAGESEHPVSSSSRQALVKIREGGHRMVSCEPLREEYKKRSGLLARKWQASMVARKQVIWWAYDRDAGLRDRLSAAFPADATAKRDAALKDAHLLEAAEATGKRIVSRDHHAKGLFQSVCGSLQQYGAMLWGDLTSSPERVLAWIDDGLAEASDLRLCPLPSTAKTGSKKS